MKSNRHRVLFSFLEAVRETKSIGPSKIITYKIITLFVCLFVCLFV